jgi:hypothetical protein
MAGGGPARGRRCDRIPTVTGTGGRRHSARDASEQGRRVGLTSVPGGLKPIRFDSNGFKRF